MWGTKSGEETEGPWKGIEGGIVEEVEACGSMGFQHLVKSEEREEWYWQLCERNLAFWELWQVEWTLGSPSISPCHLPHYFFLSIYAVFL